MRIDFHAHTSRSMDAIPNPRQLVKTARKKGLDAITITDHNRFFPKTEARRLSREFGILVISGIEGGQIAIQKHWIGVGIDHLISRSGIDRVLSAVRSEGGLSIAPHPHTRLGYEDYARLGFDAVESVNGSEKEASRCVRNTSGVPEVAGSDAHSLPMLGHTWTEVEADPTVESVLEAVRKGRSRPGGTFIPSRDLFMFYPQFIVHRILCEPRAAVRHACRIIREVRRIRAQGSIHSVCEYIRPHGDQIS